MRQRLTYVDLPLQADLGLEATLATLPSGPLAGVHSKRTEKRCGVSQRLDRPIRDALREALGLMLAHLGALERRRLEREVMKQLNEFGSPELALSEAFNGEQAQTHGQWVLMTVDVKGSDQVEWQAQELVAAHKLPGDFAWRPSGRPVLDGLSALDAWLRARRHVYLHLDLLTDCYWGCVVPMQRQAEIVRLLREAGLTVRTDAEQRAFEASFRASADPLTGEVPRGVGAPTKSLRKLLGGGHELLGVLRYGLIGVFLSTVGLLFVFFGVIGSFRGTMLGVGLVCTALGGWSLRVAVQAFRNLRSIARA